MACITIWLQTGQRWSPLGPQMRLAQSRQNKLWPQGTRAAVTSLSPHTRHSRFIELPVSSESVGLALVLGDAREPITELTEFELGKVQMLGDSPIPSSQSIDSPRLFQMLINSGRIITALFELVELDEELQLLPVDEAIVVPLVVIYWSQLFMPKPSELLAIEFWPQSPFKLLPDMLSLAPAFGSK
jgi:hypothetical protein